MLGRDKSLAGALLADPEAGSPHEIANQILPVLSYHIRSQGVQYHRNLDVPGCPKFSLPGGGGVKGTKIPALRELSEQKKKKALDLTGRSRSNAPAQGLIIRVLRVMVLVESVAWQMVTGDHSGESLLILTVRGDLEQQGGMRLVIR